MMKILILQTTDRHTEILGGILELLKHSFKGTLKITILTIGYKESFVNYYKNIYNSRRMIITTINKRKGIVEKIAQITDDFDLNVYLTGLDYINDGKITDPKKTIVVSHNTTEIKEIRKTGVHIIGLPPFYKKYHIPFYLNVCKVEIVPPRKHSKLNLLIVGLNASKDLPLLYYLLRKIDLTDRSIVINIINYHPLPKKLKCASCKLHIGISSRKMISLIKKADYILPLVKKGSVYHSEQLTGILPLAITFGIPLIIDSKTAKIYNISSRIAVIYNDNADAFEKISNIQPNLKMHSQMIKFRNAVIAKQHLPKKWKF